MGRLETPKRGRRVCAPGFTLVELLVAVVVLAILASIAMRVVGSKEKAYLAAMKSDLRNASSMQEAYFADSLSYANDVADLAFVPTDEVQFEVLGVVSGFAMRTTHALLPGARCAIFLGTVDPVFGPATEEGLMACDGTGGGGGAGGGGGGGGGGGCKGQGGDKKSEQGKEHGQGGNC